VNSPVLSRLLFVAYFLEVGALLVLLPWLPFWDRNYFGDVFPLLGAVARNDFVRGAVSGLGVVNLVAGFSELVSVFRFRSR